MSVSRETFKKTYGGILKNPSVSLFLSDIDVLPCLLSFHKNSCLVLESTDFESVFSLLYKHSIPGFSVLTNKKGVSPLGFEGPLDRFKNRLGVVGSLGSRFVLIDETTNETVAAGMIL